MSKKSPRIASLAWGQTVVDGLGSGKDFKLWPGGGRAWDWNETNTRHVPGIQPADVAELLENGCEAVVLSRGMLCALHTCEETLALLHEHGVDVHVAESKKAAAIYNDLVSRGIAVGCLMHSTC